MAGSSGWDPGVPPGPEFGKPTVPDWMGGVGISQLQILSLQAVEADKKLSPFIVGKSMQDLVGEIEGTTTEANGMKYVLRARDARQATKLLTMRKLFDETAVTVVLHPILNKRRCVISCREIQDETEDELLKWMAKEGVVGVKRITRMQEGKRMNTPTIILTLNGTAVPEYLKVGALRIKTRIYVPDPMICFKCYAYGHTKFRCKGVAKCKNCSQVHDLEDECKAAPFCFHCQGQHGPANRICPTYVMEKEIVRLRFSKGISYDEAVKQIKAGGGSYAAVSKLQQRITPEFQQIKEKDDLIKQLTDTIAKLTTRIEELEKKQKNKKDKKRAKRQSKQDGTESGTEMETDSSIQAAAASGKVSEASSLVDDSDIKSNVPKVHKRHYTSDIDPPKTKKTPEQNNVNLNNGFTQPPYPGQPTHSAQPPYSTLPPNPTLTLLLDPPRTQPHNGQHTTINR